MDLFGPTRIEPISGKMYALVIIDDDTGWSTWVIFLNYKDEALRVFYKFMKLVQNKKCLLIIAVTSDHNGEF